MASKDIEQQFKADLEEAPYIAHIKTILPMSYRFPSSPSRVLDHLYLGSEEDALDVRHLRELGITHVLNCAAAYCTTGQSYYGPNIKYLQFDAEDDLEYDMMQHFQQAYDFIEDARRCGGKVLVHCIMGINRSGVLSVAYVMVSSKIGPISAAEQVRKSRASLLTNDGFQRQLIRFARGKGLLHLDYDRVNKSSGSSK